MVKKCPHVFSVNWCFKRARKKHLCRGAK